IFKKNQWGHRCASPKFPLHAGPAPVAGSTFLRKLTNYSFACSGDSLKLMELARTHLELHGHLNASEKFFSTRKLFPCKSQWHDRTHTSVVGEVAVKSESKRFVV